MTNNEAIAILTGYKNNPLVSDMAIEAFSMAIKALEQEPCEDAISRHAVEDAIYDYSRACDVNYAQIMEYIDKLPSVNPQEPKTGKWKKVIDEKGYIDGNLCNFYHYECSICGTMNRYFDNTNYCPDCGAKMIEPQESEDKG